MLEIVHNLYPGPCGYPRLAPLPYWEAELRRKQLETVRETAGSSFAPYLEPTIACEEIAVFVCHERFGVVSNKRLRYYLKPFSEVRSTGLRFHHRQPNLGMKVWYHIA